MFRRFAVNFMPGPEQVVVDSPPDQEGLGGSQVCHGSEDVVGPLSQDFPYWEPRFSKGSLIDIYLS